jgi:hypothetical protein
MLDDCRHLRGRHNAGTIISRSDSLIPTTEPLHQYWPGKHLTVNANTGEEVTKEREDVDNPRRIGSRVNGQVDHHPDKA